MFCPQASDTVSSLNYIDIMFNQDMSSVDENEAENYDEIVSEREDFDYSDSETYLAEADAAFSVAPQVF